MSRSFNLKAAKQLTGAVLAALSLLCAYFISIDGLSEQAVHTMGVAAATLFLLIFEPFNICVTCMLSSAMLFAFGCVDTVSEGFCGFSNHILYFTTASFGISAAFQRSVLSRRLLSLVIRGKKIGVKKLIFIFMLCSALLSSIMSNVAAAVIFLPFAEAFLDFMSDKENKARTKRCMMMCITVGAMVGGMMTPAGSSMNLICLDMLERYTGGTVRFIDWIKIGLPLAVIMVIIAFFIITAVFPPKEPTEDEMSAYLSNISEKVPASSKDIYAAAVIFAVVAAWLISSWVPAINITVTAIAGLALLFVPKFGVLTYEEFARSISWPTFFIAGNLISVANAVIGTGLCDHFTKLLFPEKTSLPLIVILMQTAAVTFVFMALLPSAPAVTTILTPIIISFAQNNGLDPTMLVIASALCVSNIYLFPLDAPLAAAYDKKAFTMFELPRATIWIQLSMIIIVPLWVTSAFKFIL
ncbi:MAG: SLC13 family permease [Huintestinicola sp.]|uniref:SLC13 family permease n=1 Tax=Huintestinicola sp. TaxID=2981661 RepID=UPI003F0C4643